GNFIMCPTLCYRKARLAGRRFSPRWRQVVDLELTTRLLLEGEALFGLPEVAYASRRDPADTTAGHTGNLLRFCDGGDLYDELLGRLSHAGWGRAASVARAKLIIKLNLLYCAARDVTRCRLRQTWQKLSFLLGVLQGGVIRGQGGEA